MSKTLIDRPGDFHNVEGNETGREGRGREPVILFIAIGIDAFRAAAADLGGNCCADLEERIAEVEATTARKGTRKVSLTVSGWVNEAIFFWNDGVENKV